MPASPPTPVLRRARYDPIAWGRIVDAHPSAEVYHSPAWLDYLGRTQGAVPVVARVELGDRPVGHFIGATTRRFGLRLLGSPMSGWGTQVMGFLLDEPVEPVALLAALRRFAYQTLGCVYVELGDRRLTAETIEGSGFVAHPGHTMMVDLSGSEDDILKRMNASSRYYARRGARNGLVAEIATGMEFADEYYDQLVDVFHTSGLVPTYPVARVRELITTLEPTGQLLLMRLVGPDGERIGTTLSIGRNERAVLWGAAFYRQYSRLYPVEPLQWAAMRYWREQGARWYDLSGTHSSKSKFTRYEERLDRFHHTRFPVLEHGRSAARRLFYTRQRLSGRIATWRSAAADAPAITGPSGGSDAATAGE